MLQFLGDPKLPNRHKVEVYSCGQAETSDALRSEETNVAKTDIVDCLQAGLIKHRHEVKQFLCSRDSDTLSTSDYRIRSFLLYPEWSDPDKCSLRKKDNFRERVRFLLGHELFQRICSDNSSFVIT